MDVIVRFAYNKRTGQVEEFTIEQESGLPLQEHDQAHDRVAAEIGGVIERNPRVAESAPSRRTEPLREPREAEEPTQRTDRERQL